MERMPEGVKRMRFTVLASLLALDLSLGLSLQCTGTSFAGSTDCDKQKGCVVLKTFSTNSSDACCASCFSTPACDSWTLCGGDGMCRIKKNGVANPQKGSSSTSGTRVVAPTPAPIPTPAPTQPPTPAPRPAPHNVRNVLLIIVDDLRPNIGAYGHSFMRTPNLDSFARDALLFQRAYVQYSFCAPSRNSFMTGRRPDATRVFNFVDHFRNTTGATWRSMPQYFKENGFLTMGGGKIYHPEVPPAKDVPFSWSSDEVPYYSPDGCAGASVDNPGVQCVDAWEGCKNASNASTLVAGDIAHWCEVNVSEVRRAAPSFTLNGSRPLADQKIADNTVAQLRRAATDPKGRPFFIAMGLHKPHLPFASPSEFHDMQLPLEQLQPPLHSRPPIGSPAAAWHPGGFGNPACSYNVSVPPDQTLPYRRAYYAAISYTDSLIGEALAELDRLNLTESTVVAFLGDHGWQLGEMDEWRKMTNWELGVRIPLMIRAPHKRASRGKATGALVEAVDLYQTLASLAGLPAPASQGERLQGMDLSPLFDNPPARGSGLKTAAFSQFAKNSKPYGGYGVQPWNPCTKCSIHEWSHMGYSLRNDRWRYTEWVQWNKTAAAPLWGDFGNGGGRELYDHEGDYGADMDAASDVLNLASRPEHAALVKNLSAQLHAHFNGDHL